MLTDLYEFSMANGYYAILPHDRQARFDVFYRRVPDNGSFVIAAGLQQVVEQVANWHFSKENIEYLKLLKEFSPNFLDYLSKIKNGCTIQALPEGTPVFPREPIISISGPLIEAQLLETFVLNIINHQSLIATKSWQINHAAQGLPIMEFGARRAQGPDAATYGARAAVIGGCTSTSNLQAASQFHIPAAGTMAHAWVESFPDELSAFQAWAKVYPNKISYWLIRMMSLNQGFQTLFGSLSKLGPMVMNQLAFGLIPGIFLNLPLKHARCLMKRAS